MPRFVPFEAWHAMELVAQNAQGAENPIPIALAPEAAAVLEEHGGSWTCIDGQGVLACGGNIQQWPGRYQAWAFFTPAAGRHMLFITRFVKMKLSELCGRIEFTVIKDYEVGHRWAKMLGFRVETPIMEQYGPAGETHTGYVRVNKGG